MVFDVFAEKPLPDKRENPFNGIWLISKTLKICYSTLLCYSVVSLKLDMPEEDGHEDLVIADR